MLPAELGGPGQPSFSKAVAQGIVKEYLLQAVGYGCTICWIDGEGRILVRTSQREIARTSKTPELHPFPHPKLLERIRAGEGPGHHVLTPESGPPLLAVWSYVRASGWIYLVMGEEAALTGAGDG